ncbi:TIGR03364 family FAD-dependent oxidoreductase [Flavilitoribacter nigricans]|uniref:TIGR03364 family FAD-dependent oxidoreductase n=1 Tax=Flavilitoribacter nigricans (strain ATCC 23147 / DSM 23189 / NBRC 102662 / NCIMB 1420 / SS-2) TaxID=1122177 RepID=A0A2D0MYM6_FLAN2|nr:TIGR03364 family FAD-dependent oxidoreductase [Flavilitoribacter nigricans]PHN01226.1 TIGR03364 family FAD-dependent oxidoreductase [Flavilitoribacter nigricans DSM 23189 = NBRC 102662]
MNTYDLAIVGGGMLGVAHAYHALRAGKRVAILEKDQQPCSATVRNFGQIVPSGMDAKWQAYGRRSLEIYRDLQRQTDITVVPHGSIYVASDDEEMTLLEELAGINRDNDYTSQLLSRTECLERYPGLRADYVQGGLFFTQELTVDPRQAIHRIIAWLRERYELAYFPGTLVTAIENRGADRVLLNNRGVPIAAAKVLVCSGSDFQTLFPETFRRSSLQSVKLQMLLTKAQSSLKINGSVLTGWTIRRYESFHECPSFARIKAGEDANAYHRQWGIHILFKQAADGRVILGDSHEYWDAGSDEPVDFQIDDEMNEFMIRAAREIYQLETYAIDKTWIGIYSQCKDRDIFEMEVMPDVHIVTGIGGKGMTGSFGYAEQHIATLLGVGV